VAYMGKRILAYRVLVRKSEGKRPYGKIRRRLEDSINTNIKEIF
jgi:hypothetical protein